MTESLYLLTSISPFLLPHPRTLPSAPGNDHSITLSLVVFVFESSPKDIFIDFRETERERERSIDQLPLVHALTGAELTT